MEKFIFVAGGSFQGKSLMALRIAAQFKFSGVLTTDMIRNFHNINDSSNEVFSTSTYLMKPEDFNRQKEKVSDSLKKIMEIYRFRGEKMIFEGVHFSDQFIRSIKDTEYLKIFINNKISPKERFEYKKKTRSNFSYLDNETRTYEHTTYFEHEQRMMQIHEDLKKVCVENNFTVIDYTDINEAFMQCEELVDNYLNNAFRRS